jgi:hypothetical protein
VLDAAHLGHVLGHHAEVLQEEKIVSGMKDDLNILVCFWPGFSWSPQLARCKRFFCSGMEKAAAR